MTDLLGVWLAVAGPWVAGMCRQASRPWQYACQFLQSNQIELREINDKNEETGLFKGKFTSSEIFEGTWTNIKTKQTFPFKLTEEKNGIANVTYEHLRNENCNAKKKDSNKRCSYIDINMIKVSLPNVKISEQINNSIIKRILGDEYNTIKEYLNTVNVDEEYHREVDIDFIVEINEKDFIFDSFSLSV